MTIVTFNPNRQTICLAGRDFLLDLNLREDGTGVARLSEVFADGGVCQLSCAFRPDPSHGWTFTIGYSTGTGSTPRAAALGCLSRELGLPANPE
jgi:hypothetical protein